MQKKAPPKAPRTIRPQKPRNVCVYCGSGPGNKPAYTEAAQTLGRMLATSGIGLVYGGGSLGLMGEVARATLAAGGRVTGIIPEFLSERERTLTEADEVIVTARHAFAQAADVLALGCVRRAAGRHRHTRGIRRATDMVAARPAPQTNHPRQHLRILGPAGRPVRPSHEPCIHPHQHGSRLRCLRSRRRHLATYPEPA